MIKKQNKITVNEFCLLNRMTKVNKDFMNSKFKDETYTESEWKKILKKDRITF